MKRVLRKLSISLVSLVVFIGVGEVVCRIAGYAPVIATEYAIVGDPDFQYRGASHQDTVHVHRVNGQEYPVPVKTNRYGQRSDDYPEAKPAGEYRILGIGDSLAFGPSVETPDNYFSQLQKGYDLAPPSVGRVRVANAGVIGYSTIHYRNWALTQIPRLAPDVVVVSVYFGNDMVLTPTGKAVIPVPWQPLLGVSALVTWWDGFYRAKVWQRITAMKQDKSYEEVSAELERYRGKEPQDLSPEEQRKLWEHSLGHLEAIARAAREHDMLAVCLLLPTKPLTDVESTDPAYAWLRDAIGARGLHVIDALHHLQVIRAEAWLPYDPGHLAPAGHEQVARALFTELGELGVR